jgi:uncharacterized RDD family membrane protein YckC
MAEWFYMAGQERRGPICDADFSSMRASGELQPAQLVWRAGMEKWQPLQSVDVDAPAVSASLSYASPGTFAPVYASFGDRLLAWVIDFFVVAGIRIGVMAGVGVLSIPIQPWVDASEARRTAVGMLVLALLYGSGLLYYALMECSLRQGTLGKLARGIQVCDIEGGPPSLVQTMVRYVLRLFSGLMFGFVFLMIAITARRQALHDIGANCVIVRKQPATAPAAVYLT